MRFAKVLSLHTCDRFQKLLSKLANQVDWKWAVGSFPQKVIQAWAKLLAYLLSHRNLLTNWTPSLTDKLGKFYESSIYILTIQIWLRQSNQFRICTQLQKHSGVCNLFLQQHDTKNKYTIQSIPYLFIQLLEVEELDV